METNRQRLVERIAELSSPRQPIPTDVEPRLTKLEGIRAVAFDIYGTLFTSGSGDVGTIPEVPGAAAFVEALRAMRIDAPTEIGPAGDRALRNRVDEAHTARRLKGVMYPEIDIREIWRDVFHDLKLTISADLTGDKTGDFERFAVEYECRANPVWSMPGAREALAACRERGLMLGIVSNAQFFTPLLFEALFGASLPALGFAEVRCVYSYELLEAKPSPRLYKELMLRLGRGGTIAPGEVLYIGNDIRNDIWPAQQVGMRTVLFAGDGRSLRLRADDPKCRDVRPHAEITSLSQFSALLS